MKGKIIFYSICLMLASSGVMAQNKNVAKSIISAKAEIKSYHSQTELQAMQKGELLDLYIERINVLVKMLPYIALTTNPGVTITDLGIPNDSKNRKVMEEQSKAISDFIEKTDEFQRKITPYSDTNSLIASILFYENTLKALHELERL